MRSGPTTAVVIEQTRMVMPSAVFAAAARVAHGSVRSGRRAHDKSARRREGAPDDSSRIHLALAVQAIPGAAHAPQWETPEAFDALVVAFLDETEDDSGVGTRRQAAKWLRADAPACNQGRPRRLAASAGRGVKA